jgi:hypothetical protein
MMDAKWKVLAVLILFSSAASSADQARLPGSVCVTFSGNAIVQPPDELKKVRVSSSEYVQTLKDCDYRAAISGLTLGNTAGDMFTCTAFGTCKARADQCAHGDLSELEVEKIFYATYFQALSDMSIFMFKCSGSGPTLVTTNAFTRADVHSQCDEIGPEKPIDGPAPHETVVSAAVSGGGQATK